MPQRALLAVAVAAIALAGCGGGGGASQAAAPIPRGLIVAQQGMAGVRLGMTPARVRAVLGRPDAVHRMSESESGNAILSWRYRRRMLTVDLHHRGGGFTVGAVSADAAPPRTRSGVGVGSSEAAVRRGVAGADCGPADPGTRWCTIGGGQRQTIFRLRRGRVYEVTVTIQFP